ARRPGPHQRRQDRHRHTSSHVLQLASHPVSSTVYSNLAYGKAMPVALVPPLNSTPPESQYSDRSTTMGTPLVTCTSAATFSSCRSGDTPFTSMLKRLVGATV